MNAMWLGSSYVLVVLTSPITIHYSYYLGAEVSLLSLILLLSEDFSRVTIKETKIQQNILHQNINHTSKYKDKKFLFAENNEYFWKLILPLLKHKIWKAKETVIHYWWDCILFQIFWLSVWRLWKALKINLSSDPAMALLACDQTTPHSTPQTLSDVYC